MRRLIPTLLAVALFFPLAIWLPSTLDGTQTIVGVVNAARPPKHRQSARPVMAEPRPTRDTPKAGRIEKAPRGEQANKLAINRSIWRKIKKDKPELKKKYEARQRNIPAAQKAKYFDVLAASKFKTDFNGKSADFKDYRLSARHYADHPKMGKSPFEYAVNALKFRTKPGNERNLEKGVDAHGVHSVTTRFWNPKSEEFSSHRETYDLKENVPGNISNGSVTYFGNAKKKYWENQQKKGADIGPTPSRSRNKPHPEGRTNPMIYFKK
jgi:hypothetical protein